MGQFKKKNRDEDIIEFMTSMCFQFHKSIINHWVYLGYGKRIFNKFEVMLYSMWVMTDAYIHELKMKSKLENYEITDEDISLIDIFNMTISKAIPDNLYPNANPEDKITILDNFRNYCLEHANDRYYKYKACLNKWFDEVSVNKDTMSYAFSCEFLKRIFDDKHGDEGWFTIGLYLIEFHQVCSTYFREKLKK